MNHNERIYLDNNATTPLDADLQKELMSVLGSWGNPSSIHWAGRASKALIRAARQEISKQLNAHPLELIFTSGASESNNTVIKGIFEEFKNKSRNEYITSTVEHPSVLKAFKTLQSRGAIVHFIKVHRNGEIDLKQYQEALSEKTALVSIMYANNETGLIFPIRQMCDMAHAQGALFHTDAVQALGKLSLNLHALGVDYASFSAHKFYALKGAGLLYAKTNAPFTALIDGGGQERSRRGGTENLLSIFSFGFMAKKLPGLALESTRLQDLRDYFEARALTEIQDISITNAGADRLGNTSSLVIGGVDGETLLMNLDIAGFAVSTGAACSSGSPEPSPALLAMGLSRTEAQNSLRVSLGWSNTQEQIDSFIETLKSVVLRLRNIHAQMQAEAQIV